MMTNDSNSQLDQQNDEIDLMDLLLILSNHIKTLLLFPVLGAICATAFVFWQDQKPKIFVSNASVFVETPTASNEIPKARAEVLISIINSGDAFAELKGKITASLGRTDRLVNLSASAASPEAAQAINKTALERIYEITAPTGVEAARLKNLLKNEQEKLVAIKKILADSALSAKANPENIRAHGELLNIASDREFAIAKIERQLSGISSANVVLAPTLPNSPQPVKKLLPLVAGIMAGGFAALLWIFIKHGLHLLRRDPQQQSKLAQIKANLGFKT
ncbi:hypothetical protein [Comamonas aquatica]|uniref:hypothetical protein n=2 Tax=Comamonas aquatica TaxID=225991 RepID=UPI0021B14D10|nr:hypothetical protein [Comamonas aquatica]MDH0370517.1 hypothetical protein [Comamonas aquatica]MDH0899172.1 hypothetical protein [Comamonas aquatica]MDH1678265.1 hypothetical protein [Comamonas aquatica]